MTYTYDVRYTKTHTLLLSPLLPHTAASITAVAKTTATAAAAAKTAATANHESCLLFSHGYF